jgi:hypothetical protein
VFFIAIEGHVEVDLNLGVHPVFGEKAVPKVIVFNQMLHLLHGDLELQMLPALADPAVLGHMHLKQMLVVDATCSQDLRDPQIDLICGGI